MAHLHLNPLYWHHPDSMDVPKVARQTLHPPVDPNIRACGGRLVDRVDLVADSAKQLRKRQNVPPQTQTAPKRPVGRPRKNKEDTNVVFIELHDACRNSLYSDLILPMLI